MPAYYNEFDPFAAAWLRNLISAGLIMAGEVDERSIVEVQPDDLRDFTRCHFFAGIAGWDLALHLARWPVERPVWTGSCPCQPLSVAGQRKGHDDERHLWPAFHNLIAECRPAAVFGEQVGSKDGREWASAVRADLEADRYAVGIVDLGAASVGAPHIRQRLWWVADADGMQSEQHARQRAGSREATRSRTAGESSGHGDNHGVADANSERRGSGRPPARREARASTGDARSGQSSGVGHADRHEQRRGRGAGGEGGARSSGLPDARGHGEAGSMADASDADRRGRERGAEAGTWPDGLGRERSSSSSIARELGEPAGAGSQGRAHRREDVPGPGGPSAERAGGEPARPVEGRGSGSGEAHGGWANADWLRCRDGRWRPVEPGTFPLASGIPNRLGALRGYGNAINPLVAAAFIEAFLRCKP